MAQFRLEAECMPELPDLTVFAENLNARLKGKTICSVECHEAKRLNTSPEQLRDSLSGASIASVQRAGKEIAFVFSNQATLFVHLMLEGEFSIITDPRSVKSAILTLGLGNESLVVSDSHPKAHVTLKLNPTPSSVPDALDVESTYFRSKISKKPKMRVKAFLVDQEILRGIGNAYADEILWQARIAPKSAVGKLPARVIDELLVSIKSVLTDAIEEIKKRNPNTISEEVRDFLRVHNPKRSKSPTGYPIMTERVAQRITYFTKEQVLYV
jgi:formamidopyrimidine-DNA glycosylase